MSHEPRTPTLRVFVYGTLKRGEKNFPAHCHTATRITEAWLWGRLFHRHTGTPILSLPLQSILAIGSLNPALDLHLQQTRPTITTRTDNPHWVRVRGELMEFPDIEDALERLDHLEGFRPQAGDSLYERFLVPLGETPHLSTWTYAIPRHLDETHYTPAPNPTCWSRGS